MDKETRKALVASIGHWVDNYLSYREPANMAFGSDDCALCQRFFHAANCRGCPVMEAAGRANCMNTPYSETACAKFIAQKAPTEANLEYLRRAIHAELMFLHSLLKPAKETN